MILVENQEIEHPCIPENQDNPSHHDPISCRMTFSIVDILIRMLMAALVLVVDLVVGVAVVVLLAVVVVFVDVVVGVVFFDLIVV